MSAPVEENRTVPKNPPLSLADREAAYDELRQRVALRQSERADRARHIRHLVWLGAVVSTAAAGSAVVVLVVWSWLS